MEIGFAFDWRHLPWWLAASLLAIALVYLGLRFLERRRHRRLQLVVETKLAPRLLPGYDARVRRPLVWLTMAGVVFLAVTFAQPHWGRSWQEVRRASRDIVILLDTSESMRAANPLPTRLDRAKQKLSSLLDMAGGDRFALIAFSGAAALQCPLTMDHAYFRSVLDTVDTDTISKEGTNIAAALEGAIELFEKEDAETGRSGRASRAVLLISDGEQVDGDAIEAAERASDFARVFVIGVGDPNGAEVTLPDWMGRYRVVMDGDKPHLSKLDEDTLSRIAVAGNGAYTRSRIDTWDVEQLYSRFDVLSVRDTSSDVRMRLVNRYQWPLMLAILAFAGEGLWLVLMPWLRHWRLKRPSAARTNGEKAGTEYA
ncbi:MAG: VWA domain-containing protein [Candidatus Hydrogenedentes bacterium]|nr:VWA domain-containing protein [Candidatus Hydrogenedentota bacterium]